MIQLTVTTQGGSIVTELDTSASPIELNYQYWDLNNPMSSRSPYTYNFTLPYSKTNDAFFSFYFNANTADGTFKATKETEAALYVDGQLVMQGILQLHGCGEKEQGYSVTILEQIAKVFDLIKGMTWPQLFTTDAGTVDTDLDHALTWSNVTDSWTTTNDITTGSVGAGTIVYPLADGGQGTAMNTQQASTGSGFFYNHSTGNGGNITTYGMSDQYVKVANMKPAIRIAYLIEYIFKRVGYTIDSTFIASADFQKIYMFLALHTLRVTNRPTYGFNVGISGNMQLPASSASVFFPVSFTNETSPFYDPDALITGGNFTAPYDGVYTFSVTVVCNTTSGNVLQGYYLTTRLTVNGQTPVSDQNQSVYYQTVSVVNHQYMLSLDAGDVVKVYVSSSSSTVPVIIQQSGAQTATMFSLTQILGSGGLVDVSANFPNITVDKWLKAIIERFNLVIVSTPDAPTVIQIEPWHIWWSSGTTQRDWTEVVDQDSIKIEPTTKYQKKRYLFTDAEGANFGNLWWQHHYGYPKGRYEFINENDFTTAEATTETVFQPYRNRPVYPNIANTGTSIIPNVLLPYFWDWDDGSNGSIYLKKFVPNKPVLAYYNGLQDIGNNGQFIFDSTTYTQYPYFSEYNSVGVDENTQCLRWGYDYPDNFNAPFVSGGTTAGVTLNYMWRVYWSQMFSEIYSTESRVMECKVDLSYTDLYNLRFNDSLYLDGCYWRVLSISNFSLTSDDLCNAVLVKVLDRPVGRASEFCSARVESINTDGTVNFVDASGSPVSATETCCTLNGFVWDETNNRCFARDVSGGHGNGGGNGGGGVGGDDSNPTNNIEGLMPTAYGDFSHGSNTTQFVQQRTIAGNITSQLYARTTGTTPVNAALNTGATEWLVPQDNVVLIQLRVVSVQVGGTGATVGDTLTQFVQTTVANTRDGAGKQTIARSVGSSATIAENKDTGLSSRVSISVQQGSDGDVATFAVQCVGDNNVDYQWFIEMEMTTLQLEGDSASMAQAVFFNLDPNVPVDLNLSPDELLYFNLQP